MNLEALAVSTGVVALGEIGGQTQSATAMPAARWQRAHRIAAIVVASLGAAMPMGPGT